MTDFPEIGFTWARWKRLQRQQQQLFKDEEEEEKEREKEREREREREQKMPGGEKNSRESSKKLESRRTDFLSVFLSRSGGLNSQVYVDTQKTS